METMREIRKCAKMNHLLYLSMLRKVKARQLRVLRHRVAIVATSSAALTICALLAFHYNTLYNNYLLLALLAGGIWGALRDYYKLEQLAAELRERNAAYKRDSREWGLLYIHSTESCNNNNDGDNIVPDTFSMLLREKRRLEAQSSKIDVDADFPMILAEVQRWEERENRSS